ncbi:oxaloacetate decarboxylase [uncultured Oscillibacter sp.]|uniref:isocitrate lyase/PEP mutase family protein n=1 Tax=uncultured Oscillibacter sp. TaxID=876091 RepID=UPI0025CF5FFF|nr:isocitrate lyase/phosphoenolpyruvate mutase family protein [uncultured Oscillibacter sp.]
MTNGERLRELLAGDEILMVPGAYDAWSAKLVAKVGFPAVYMTGYGVSASLLGVPDIGLISFKEMLDAAQNITRSSQTITLCDADTGFGGRLNVMRTVEAYEAAGVAAIQLEDQVMPKRCGHMEGKQLIPAEEMVAKVKIARATRKDPSLCIIARTDATAVDGFEAALKRAKAYEEAGADIIFLEALTSQEQMQQACSYIRRPMLANMVEHGKTPMLTAPALQQIGYKLAIYPTGTLFAATKAVLDFLRQLKQDQTLVSCLPHMVDFPEFNQLMGLEELREYEQSFACGQQLC